MNDRAMSVQARAKFESLVFELSLYGLEIDESLSAWESDFDEMKLVEAVNALVEMLFGTEWSKEVVGAIFRLLEAVYSDPRFDATFSILLESVANRVPNSSGRLGTQDLLVIRHYCSVLHALNKRQEGKDSASVDAWVLNTIDKLGCEISSLPSAHALRKATAMVSSKIAGNGSYEVLVERWLKRRKNNELGIPFILLSGYLNEESLSSYKSYILTVFREVVLLAKTIPLPILAASGAFLSLLNQADWSSPISDDSVCGSTCGNESIESTCLNLLKMSPETHSFLMYHLVSQLCRDRIDLSEFSSAGGLTGAIRMLKASKAEIRFLGCKFLLETTVRCRDVKTIGNVFKKLIEAIMTKGETAQSRASMACCLIMLVTKQMAVCEAAIIEGSVSISDLLEIAKNLDKETDRACGALLGKALGIWLWLFRKISSSSEKMIDMGTDSREFICSNALRTRLCSALSSDKGCLSALMALSTMACLSAENGHSTEDMSGAEDVATAALRIARKASAGTMVEASLALSVLFHLPSIAKGIIEKAKCWDTFESCSSFLYSTFTPVMNPSVTPASSVNFPSELKQEMWIMDGQQVAEADAAIARAFCLCFLRDRAVSQGISLLDESKVIDTTNDANAAFQIVRSEHKSLLQLGKQKQNTPKQLKEENHDLPMGLAMCILHPLRQARTEAFKQIKDRLFSPSSLSAQAPDGGVAIHVLQALESHLAATPEGKYPYNRVGEAVLSIARWTFAELQAQEHAKAESTSVAASPEVLLSLCEMVCHPYANGWSVRRAHALTNAILRIAREYMEPFNDSACTTLPTVQKLYLQKIITGSVDACSAMRWRASALSQIRPLGSVFDLSLVDSLLDTIEDCALQKVSMAHWDLLYDLSAKVSAKPTRNSSGNAAMKVAPPPAPAPAPAPASTSAPAPAPAPAPAGRERRKKKVINDDDDDDDFLGRVKRDQKAKKDGPGGASAVSTAPSASSQTSASDVQATAPVMPKSSPVVSPEGSSSDTTEPYPWDEEIAAADAQVVLALHSRVQCVFRILGVVEALCGSSAYAARKASYYLATRLAPLLVFKGLSQASESSYPSISKRVFHVLSVVFAKALLGEPLLESRSLSVTSALVYVYSDAGVAALTSANARIAEQVKDSQDDGSKRSSESGGRRAGGSLVIIPPAVVGLLRDLSVSLQAGESLIYPSSFAILWPVLAQVLLVQHDARLPGWKACYHILGHLASGALSLSSASNHASDTSIRTAVIAPLLQSAIKLTLHAAPMAADIRGMLPPTDLLCRLVAVSMLHGISLASLTDVNGGLYSKSKTGRILAATALLEALRSMPPGSDSFKENFHILKQPLWVLRHDSESEVAGVMKEVWALWCTQVVANFGQEAMRDTPGGVSSGSLGLCEGGDMYSDFIQLSFDLFEFPIESVRKAAAEAIAGGVAVFSDQDTQSRLLDALASKYSDALPPKLDMSLLRNRRAAAGNAKTEDKFRTTRLSIASCIAAIGQMQSTEYKVNDHVYEGNEETLTALIKFLCESTLIDPSSSVRAAMLDAGKALVGAIGDKYDATRLMAFFEAELKCPPEPSLTQDEKDFRHENLAILLGTTGKYLKKDVDTLISIVQMLVTELKTPSETVQEAVADCLVPLVQAMRESDYAKDTLELLLSDATSASSYGDRRGAAYGIAAFVKAMGIVVVKSRDIVNRLKVAAEKGTPQSRQGALGVFECLCARLGFLFEPYVIVIFPILLKCIANSNDLVRDGAKGALAVIMNKLTAHGMRQVLAPVLNELLEESAWKTRAEAVRLLGYIVQCASKQVAPSLPKIVQKISEAMSDPHPKVKDAAKQSMADVSGSVRNPELHRISGTLVAALSDPANKTKAALEALLQCEFMHSIDAPSLSILIPVLVRAMKDRGADLKRKSAAITGNIVSMVSDAKLLSPYLSSIVPCLQECLIDPIPDVRATAGKALGNLIGGIGETAELMEVVPWLALTLCSEESPVERSGAAAGLAEVCFSLPETRMAQVMEQLLPLSNSAKATAREGLLWFLSSLPGAIGESFATHLSACMPIIVDAFTDPAESVREVALRAGQMIAKIMTATQAKTLCGYFCEGIFQESWRIRNGCLDLLGEVLEVLATGAGGGNDDGDGFNLGGDEDGSYMWDTRVRMANITRALGQHMKAKVVAVLYIARTDISNACRQSALKVWKSLTANTTELAMNNMKEIVAEITCQIGNESADIQMIVGRTLHDTISKWGDHVLPMVLPEMTAGLDEEENEESSREGLCLGLAEVFNALSKSQYQEYDSMLLPALEKALCDVSEKVRTHAASAFGKLTKVAGLLPAEQVVNSLVKKIGTNSLNSASTDGKGERTADNQASRALRGLKEILSAKPRDVLDFLIPLAMRSPVDLRNALLLETACAAAGTALVHYLPKILHTVVKELKVLSASENSGELSAVDATAIRDALQRSVQYTMQALSADGLETCLYEIQIELVNEMSAPNRAYGFWILEQLVRYSDTQDCEEHTSTILKYVLGAVGEIDTEVLEAAAGALAAISETMPMDSLIHEVDFARSCITSTVSDARHRADKRHPIDPTTGRIQLAFFAQRRAFDAILALYNYGLSNGDVTTRVSSCYGISEILVLCDQASLKPYMSKLAGKLINVFGGKFPSQLKEAILQTMCCTLETGGAMIKAFAPQLQSTFIKGIKDEDTATRDQAQNGLSLLVKVTPRPDALVAETAGVIGPTDSREVQLSAFRALDTILDSLTKPPNATAITKLQAALEKAESYTPDFDADDDRETESRIGRVIDRVKETMSRFAAE